MKFYSVDLHSLELQTFFDPMRKLLVTTYYMLSRNQEYDYVNKSLRDRKLREYENSSINLSDLLDFYHRRLRSVTTNGPLTISAHPNLA